MALCARLGPAKGALLVPTRHAHAPSDGYRSM